MPEEYAYQISWKGSPIPRPRQRRLLNATCSLIFQYGDGSNSGDPIQCVIESFENPHKLKVVTQSTLDELFDGKVHPGCSGGVLLAPQADIAVQFDTIVKV
ncbi:hypothetical protein ACGFX8_36165 [Streptomyces sp. NPDC048362]|uniref:hypothetical protein n=1 Tax=Streptomyces sp. NPDC048362 TaxID=3365539 RepID=UPI00371DA26B